MQRHIYDKDQPEAVDVAKAMRKLTDSYKDRVLIEEIALEPTGLLKRLKESILLPVCKRGGHPCSLRLFFYVFKDEVKAWEEALRGKGWPVYVLSNHDEIRHLSRYARGKQTIPRAKILAAMLLTLRGTPFLYYGEEIGMINSRLKRSELMDPIGRRYWPFHPGRDGERTPMQWSRGYECRVYDCRAME